MDDFYCDEVLSGRSTVSVEYEDADVLAFQHTRPAYERHVVVIPKTHVRDLLSAAPPTVLAVMAAAKGVAREMVEATGACRVITNLGDYQDSKHFHVHVVSGARR